MLSFEVHKHTEYCIYRLFVKLTNGIGINRANNFFGQPCVKLLYGLLEYLGYICHCFVLTLGGGAAPAQRNKLLYINQLVRLHATQTQIPSRLPSSSRHAAPPFHRTTTPGGY